MKITKRNIAELCAFSYQQGYRDASQVLADSCKIITDEEVVEKMMTTMDFFMDKKKEELDGKEEKPVQT